MTNTIDRREFLGAAAAATVGLLAGCTTTQIETAARKKGLNVLFIMTDEHNGGCMGYAGHPYVKTPNLDALARQGVVFENAGCAFPVCTASRASIVTGTWPHTHTCHDNVGQPETNPAKGLPPGAVMTESILHERGYRTKHRGKWHAGDQRRHACYSDAADGFRLIWEWGPWVANEMPREKLNAPEGQAQLYGYPLYMTAETLRARSLFLESPWSKGQDTSLIGRTALPPEYLEEAWVATDCCDLLDRYKDGPFMITCSMHPPHAYWAISDPYYSMYNPDEIELPPNQTRPEMANGSMAAQMFDWLGPKGVREFLRCYFAQVTHIDVQVGRLVQKLKDIGQYENTLIIFTSDHGAMNGAHQMVTKAVWPVQFYREVIHVPLLISCPRLIPKGRRVQAGANGVDLMPTILDYLDLPVPAHVEGTSLRPYIDGKDDPDRPVFCEHGQPTTQSVGRSILTREWHYSFQYENWSTGGARFVPYVPPQLFSRIDDPGEDRNLAGNPKYRDVLQRLDDQLRQHLSDTHDPWLAKLPRLEA